MAKNIQKAIKIADCLVASHYKNANNIENLVKNWSGGPKELALEISSTHREVAICIQLIIDCLKEKPKRRKIAETKS